MEKAFELYPEVRLIIVAHLYGTPGKMEEIKSLLPVSSIRPAASMSSKAYTVRFPDGRAARGGCRSFETAAAG